MTFDSYTCSYAFRTNIDFKHFDWKTGFTRTPVVEDCQVNGSDMPPNKKRESGNKRALASFLSIARKRSCSERKKSWGSGGAISPPARVQGPRKILYICF